jgi:GT2 family glycosyltransferase
MLINVSEASNSGVVGVEMGSYQLGNQKIDFVQEYCLLATRQAFNHIGGFPEEFPATGNGFIFSMKASSGGFRPQVIKTQIVWHYKIFSLNVNDFERFNEIAYTLLPKRFQQIQSRSI